MYAFSRKPLNKLLGDHNELGRERNMVEHSWLTLATIADAVDDSWLIRMSGASVKNPLKKSISNRRIQV